ncbi:MAG: hypothetical protein H8E14_14325 [Candidatus Marinimicrobia bacterium]|nr:hypothetical protein [Candidatus Neomarinimicrobiota bacterium]
MITLHSEKFQKLIENSAKLRAEHKYIAAIFLIEELLSEMESDCLLNAYLEIIYAAIEFGDEEKLKQYIPKLRAIDSEIPVVKKYNQY